jgi:hypothetical protein
MFKQLFIVLLLVSILSFINYYFINYYILNYINSYFFCFGTILLGYYFLGYIVQCIIIHFKALFSNGDV